MTLAFINEVKVNSTYVQFSYLYNITVISDLIICNSNFYLLKFYQKQAKKHVILFKKIYKFESPIKKNFKLFFRIKSSNSKLLKVILLALISVWLASVVYTFYRLSPLAYGVIPLTADQVKDLRWKDTWDLIVHKH